MKLKNSALALAMAGIVAAPMAAQADSGFYGSVRIGIQNTDLDAGATSTTEAIVRGYASRMGFKGEADMGNGMTGFGKYEFSVNTGASEGPNAGTIGRRHAMVGVKGDFGKVTLGQTYHTFYNHIVGPLDNPWWGSGYAMIAYVGRTDQAISYAGDFGAVSFGATVYMDETGTDTAGDPETMDSMEVAASFDAGPVRVGVGMKTAPDTAGVGGEDIIGVTVSGIQAGPVSLGVGYQQQDQATPATGTNSSMVIDAGFGNAYVHLEQMSVDGAGAAEPSSLTLGYTQSIGRQTTAWYEFQSYDADAGAAAAGAGDWTRIRAVLKFDWK